MALLNKDSIATRLDKLEKAVTLSAKIKLEISKKETEIAQSRSSCDDMSESLKEAQTKLRDLQEALKNHENTEVVSIRSKIEELSRLIKGSDDTRISLATQKGKLLSDVEKLDSEKSARDTILRDMKAYEIISPVLFLRKEFP